MSPICPGHISNVLFLGKDSTFVGTQDTQISVMSRVLVAGSWSNHNVHLTSKTGVSNSNGPTCTANLLVVSVKPAKTDSQKWAKKNVLSFYINLQQPPAPVTMRLYDAQSLVIWHISLALLRRRQDAQIASNIQCTIAPFWPTPSCPPSTLHSPTDDDRPAAMDTSVTAPFKFRLDVKSSRRQSGDTTARHRT